MDQLPRLGKRELICLLLFTCNYVVSVWRGFLFLWLLGMGYVILLWHSLSLLYNYCDTNLPIYFLSCTGNIDLWYIDHDEDWSIFGLMVLHVVESFFTISGFLVTYLSLKRMKSDGSAWKFPWVKYYIYRFWR